MEMEELFKQLTFSLASAVEVAAGIVIAFGASEGVIKVVRLFFFQRNAPEEAKDFIRLRLGRWLALALEFELAADILRTAITPSWTEIGQLAAIIILRTALNYFLQKEIEKSVSRNSSSETLNLRQPKFRKASGCLAGKYNRNCERACPGCYNQFDRLDN